MERTDKQENNTAAERAARYGSRRLASSVSRSEALILPICYRIKAVRRPLFIQHTLELFLFVHTKQSFVRSQVHNDEQMLVLPDIGFRFLVWKRADSGSDPVVF